MPDPFSNEHPSFGAANNARLRAFLDSFGFEYEFQSATDWYKSGRFDKMLLAMLQHYDEVQAVMLPTLGEERRATYSIFLPISPKTGRVLQVPVIKTDADAGTIVYRDEDGTLVETPVTGGNVKLQWKADWAGRWFALDVDYEMYGKDLIPSAELSAKIVRILGGTPPEGFNYELFLDEEGKKISKSKGNGLSVEEWLRYAPPESLSLYMQQQPRRAKRLYFDVIPRAVDDYLAAIEKLPAEEPAKALENAAWHIHDGKAPANSAAGVNFGMLLNLASVAHTDSKDVLWQYLRRYVPGATPENAPYLDRLLTGAVAYYQDFVKASKKFRLPAGKEREALQDLADTLRKLPEDSTRRVHPERGLRGGQAPLRAGRAAPVVQDALRGPAGQRAGPAHGRLHQALRPRQRREADRARAGRRGSQSGCLRWSPSAVTTSSTTSAAERSSSTGKGFCSTRRTVSPTCRWSHPITHASSRGVTAGPMRWVGTNPSFRWSCRLPTRCCGARRPIWPSRPSSGRRHSRPRSPGISSSGGVTSCTPPSAALWRRERHRRFLTPRSAMP